jgi:hypothetical protein
MNQSLESDLVAVSGVEFITQVLTKVLNIIQILIRIIKLIGI